MTYSSCSLLSVVIVPVEIQARAHGRGSIDPVFLASPLENKPTMVDRVDPLQVSRGILERG